MRYCNRSVRAQRALASAALEVLESRCLLSAIQGHVFSQATDQAIDGLTLQLLESSNPDSAAEEAWTWVASATTDANGLYQFDGLESRHYRVFVTDGATSSANQHYIQANLYDVVTQPDATTSGMDLHLHDAGRLFGYVRTLTGAAIPGVRVVTEASWTGNENNDSWHEAVSNSDGLYELYLPLTDQQIYPIKIADAPVPGSSPTRYYAVQVAPGLYAATAGDTHGYDFNLSVGGVITGRAITDTDAHLPVGQISVVQGSTHIQNGMFEDSTGWTDSEGFFEVHGVPVGTDVYLRTDSWNWRDFAIGEDKYALGERLLGPFRLTAGQTLNISDVLVPMAGSIRGDIFGSNGQPVVGASIRIIGQDQYGGSVYLEEGDVPVSDALGQYQAAAVPPGRYHVIVNKDGWAQSVSAELVVKPGQETVCHLTLQAAAQGFTVSGALTNYNDVAPKGGDGKALPTHLIDYDGYDRNREMGVLAVPQGINWTASQLLNPEILFTGQALFTDGFADYFAPDSVPAGQYSLNLPSGPQSLAVFRDIATGLGTWQVILSDPIAVNGSAGESKTIDLTAPTGSSTISGKLTLPAGYKVLGLDGPNAGSVWAKDAAGGGPLGRAGASIAPDGSYALKQLPAGTYTLYFVLPGLQPLLSGTVTVAAGETAVRNFTISAGASASGIVTSGATPVANAVVRSDATGFTAVTDDSGHYLLRGLLPGSDTLTVQRSGYTDVERAVSLVNGQQSTVNFDVQGADASITGRVIAAGLLTDGVDNNNNGQTDEEGEQYPSGITVVAYNKGLDKSYVTYSADGGYYDFTNLAPGDYRIVASGTGFESGMYPLASSPDLVVAHEHVDLTGTDTQVALALARPKFTVTSSSNATTLSITLHSDLPLLGIPQVRIVQGSGSLGNAAFIDSQTGSVDYTLGAGDSVVQIRVQEDPANSYVPGEPSFRIFSFDVAAQLQQVAGTSFFNAQGASASIMGTQDHASVYLPPMALSTDNSGLTQATTLTVSRYGEPGQSLDSTHTTIASSYEFVIGDDGSASVQLAHEATMTMGFTVPAGLTEAQFRQTLRVGFYNNSQARWVWNDLANSNPTSGISDIQINWLSNTLTFKAAHFTKFALSVVPVNKAPTAISVQQLLALQKWPTGAYVGTLVASDPNVGDTIRYTLVSGTGSTNNSLFSISGNLLKTRGALTYPKSYSIRVRATDAGGLKYEKPLTIKVSGINAAPTKLSLSRLSVAENQPTGTVVGTFSAGDPNRGDTFTYTLVTGTGSTGNSKFTISGNQLKTKAIFNYESAKSYSIRVRVADRGGLSYIKTFTIAVTNVNETPLSVAPLTTSVLENKPVGTAVANLSTRDPDAGNTFTYSLAPGTQDNDLFTIVGNQLRTNSVFDYETRSSYQVLVRSTDQGSLFCDQLITVNIGDVIE